MRRWAAGTDQIPQGVWRDILHRLENRGADANRYMGRVNTILGQVEVVGFKTWDHENSAMREGPTKSTRERVTRIKGTVLPGTSEWVSPDDVDAEGRLKPVPSPAVSTTRGIGASTASAVGAADGIGTVIGVSATGSVGSFVPSVPSLDLSASDIAIQTAARERRKIAAQIGTGETAPIGPIPKPAVSLPVDVSMHGESSMRLEATVVRASAVLHQEMLSRIAVLEEVIALAAQPAGIGHNNPPEPIEGVSFSDEDRQAVARAIAVLKVQPTQPRASIEINNAVSTLRAIGDRLWTGMARAGAYSLKQLDSFVSEAVKSAGAEAGRRIVQSPFWWALIGSLIAVTDIVGRWVTTLPH